MNRKEFAQVRNHLGKTQTQMSKLLGVSLKGIQSFEQGWRGIPSTAERDLLILMGLKNALAGGKRPCWSVKKCPDESRRRCPVWEFGAGKICWFINGSLCRGKAAKSWEEKSKVCRTCEVFQSVFDLSQHFSGKKAGARTELAKSRAPKRKPSNN